MTAEIVRSFTFQETPEAFNYLAVQRGNVPAIHKDRAAWIESYAKSVMSDYRDMLPWLPRSCERVLDVGSGLGGIDAVLAKHFGPGFEVMLLDSDDEAPVVVRHAQPFNNMIVARRFLQANGVGSVVPVPPTLIEPSRPCGLVISLQSWCFHYAPPVYLDYVQRCCVPGTVLVLDVRRQHDTWQAMLKDTFRFDGVAGGNHKFIRMVFHA